MSASSCDWQSVSASHLWYFRLFAFVPFEGKTFDYLGTKLLAAYLTFINVFYITCYSFYSTVKLTQKVFEVDYICETITVYGNVFHYFTLYLSRDDIVKLVDNSRELWSFLRSDEEAEMVKVFERKARIFRNFLLVNALMVINLFYITFFVMMAPLPKEQWPTVFRYYVEVHAEPWYTSVQVVQFMMGYTIGVQVAAVDNVGLYLVMMACGYLRVTKNRILGAIDRPYDEEALHAEIVDCVKFHQRIMLYCHGIEMTLRKFFLVTILTTVYNMSIIGIKLLENSQDKFIYITIFTMTMFSFFTVQWAPEHLLVERERYNAIWTIISQSGLKIAISVGRSGAIGEAAYFTSNSPKVPLKTNKLLLMMMVRAQTPIQLTAGGVVNLSIETFGAMIKNAFSFFAVLRNL